MPRSPKVDRDTTGSGAKKNHDHQFEWWFQWVNDPEPETYWERRWRNIQMGRDKPGYYYGKGPTIGRPRKRKIINRLRFWR